MNRPTGRAPAGTGFEAAVVVVCGAALALGGVVHAGAWLATRFTGGDVDAGLTVWWEVLTGLGSEPGDPAAAWGPHGTGVPGPVLYWSCTAGVAVAAVAAAWALWRSWRRLTPPTRVRFGVDTDAHPARARDVAPLAVRSSVPPTGRLLLGRMAPRGPFLATEDRQRHPATGRTARRQGSRGSVALIGPTQSGKTALLSSAMIGWDGPVIALSVKRDLYDVTAAARSHAGDLAVFDPGASTGLPTARWTPLRDVHTASGALRAARALAAAIPRNGVQGGDYWAQQGETLVSAYMAVAGLSARLPASPDDTDTAPLTIRALTEWAFRGAGITDETIDDLVRRGQQATDRETKMLADAAELKLMALQNEDPKIRASIYATARMAFEAWAEPSVAHSASTDPRNSYNSDAIWDRSPRFVDLNWLIGDATDERANTLYLVAPDTEFTRLAPVLGGLLGDLRQQLHAWDIAGRRLTKPLLIVIDEAAQLELAWLPEEVSTIAGLGGMFVTCWQSKAQIDHRYGTLSDAVLGGHRSKVIFTGTDDPATLTWLRTVAGTEHVARRSWSADTTGGRRSISEATQREDLLAPHVTRQMTPGDAVLIHGTLPPIHLRTIRWWDEETLRSRVPLDATGHPVPPTTGTCPVTGPPARDRYGDGPIGRSGAAPDVVSTTAPGPSSGADDSGDWAGRGDHGVGQDPEQDEGPATALPGSAGAVTGPLVPNRYAGVCKGCGLWVLKGAGTTAPLGPGDVTLCTSCHGHTATEGELNARR